MLNLIVWLIVGGLIGYGASTVMHPNAHDGMTLNVIIGASAGMQSKRLIEFCLSSLCEICMDRSREGHLRGHDTLNLVQGPSAVKL